MVSARLNSCQPLEVHPFASIITPSFAMLIIREECSFGCVTLCVCVCVPIHVDGPCCAYGFSVVLEDKSSYRALWWPISWNLDL